MTQVAARLLLENQAWSDEVRQNNSALFPGLAKGQQPKFFWIGCADSRVPAESIVNAAPGEIFVHRAIANMAMPEDLSVMSALQYAVEVLGVSDVIVCGHEACGGIKAAILSGDMRSDDAVEAEDNYIAKRIAPLRRLYGRHRAALDEIEAENSDAKLAAQVDRLVEINVIAQIRHIEASSVVINARKREHPLRLHGWIYGFSDGRLREVIRIDGTSTQVEFRQAA